MKIEVAASYRMGEIVYVAGVLVDELVKTEISGTDVWPHVKDTWIDHIRGKRPLDKFDLTAKGLRVGYRGYLENIDKMKILGASLVLDEPRIFVSVKEEGLTQDETVAVAFVLNNVTNDFDLANILPQATLVFPKIVYATAFVVFDTNKLGLD